MKKIFVLFLLLAVLTACGSATSTPTPKPGAIIGYTEIDCGNASVIEGFTNYRCYELDKFWHSIGIVGYIGWQIRAVGIAIDIDAPDREFSTAQSFITDAVTEGDWNLNDVLSCWNALWTIPVGGTQVYGDISITLMTSSDGELMEVFLVKHTP